MPDSRPDAPRVRSPRRPAETYPPYPSTPEAERLAGWLRTLSVELIQANEWTCPPGWSILNRRIANDMWFCVLDGEYACRLADDRRDRPLGPGDLFLIPRGEEHTILRVAGDCRMASAHFLARVLGSVDLCTLTGLRGVFRGKDSPYAMISQQLAREHALQPVGWERTTQGALTQALMHMLRNDPSNMRTGSDGQVLDLARLQPALERIEARLHDPGLRVSELAEAVHVSEVALRRKFAQALRASPVEFLRRRRIDRACLLLRSGEMPIKEIAERCGFGDLPFFHRVFRSVTGTTPARYRRGDEV